MILICCFLKSILTNESGATIAVLIFVFSRLDINAKEKRDELWV